MEGTFLELMRGLAGQGPAGAPGMVQSQPAPLDMRSLIIETADELGMPPAVLATIISYETAGTFDPRKKGPTTQWGQHEGLIQFGQPQQQEYGVDLSSEEAAIRSQLGRDGAIVRYFRSNGWQPGMSELDAYSIVNAGAPGRYNASDANNGGAAGTVADKVRDQFGPHRQKAIAMLGGEFAPQTGMEGEGPGRVDRNPDRLAWAYANGRMTPEDAALYEEGIAAGYFKKPAEPQAPQVVQAPQVDPLDTYRAVAMRQAPPPIAPIQFMPAQALPALPSLSGFARKM